MLWACRKAKIVPCALWEPFELQIRAKTLFINALAIYASLLILDIVLAICWKVITRYNEFSKTKGLKPLWRSLRQTAAVWFLVHILPICLCINLACILWLEEIWWFYLPYLIYCLTRSLNRDSFLPKLRKWITWDYAADYFPLEVVNTNKKKIILQKKPLLIGYHPHGIFALGCILTFCRSSELFQQICDCEVGVATLNVVLRIPIFSDFLLSMGVISASSEAIRSFLKRKPNRAVVVVVGGARESELISTGYHSVFLSTRRGFFKIALDLGAYVIPVYTFGEDSLYTCPDGLWKRLMLPVCFLTRKYLGFSLPFFVGAGISYPSIGLLPRKIPLMVTVGGILDCDKYNDAAEDNVPKIKEDYRQVIEKLFESLKDRYYSNPEKEKLIFEGNRR